MLRWGENNFAGIFDAEYIFFRGEDGEYQDVLSTLEASNPSGTDDTDTASVPPPNLEITELKVVHLDGKNYWQVSGEFENYPGLGALYIDYKISNIQNFYGGIALEGDAIASDGSFSGLFEIGEWIPNGEIQLFNVSYEGAYFPPVRLTTEDELLSFNNLIENKTYIKNPHTSDVQPPSVSILDVKVINDQGNSYFQISGSYEDASELSYLEFWYSIDGYGQKVTVLASDLDDSGAFSSLSYISEFYGDQGPFNIGNAYFYMGFYVDVNGNIAAASNEDLEAINYLLSQLDEDAEPEPTEPTNPLDPIDSVPSDTTPPEVNITELYITYIDGDAYWQVSGSYNDASELNYFQINYSTGPVGASISVSASDLDSDGNFSILFEIPDSIPNGEVEIYNVNYQDVNGNAGSLPMNRLLL